MTMKKEEINNKLEELENLTKYLEENSDIFETEEDVKNFMEQANIKTMKIDNIEFSRE